ncbi:MAG TPA: YceI family protein [Candidatus Thermoplasmatota archaeon]|nr:YceI family protein [Candidatus Thermoplasmatota archaeon]
MAHGQTATQQPASATWRLDPQHSSAEFSVRHMMITTVRGKMPIRSATITGDASDPSAARIEAVLDPAGIDTGAADRDQHLRSPDFFDVAAHPEITFRSTKVRATGSGSYEVEGQLTMRGVARDVVLQVEKEGEGKDPWGGWRAGVTATATIDRRDWGLAWNQVLETGGVLVSEKVKVTLNLQFVRA